MSDCLQVDIVICILSATYIYIYNYVYFEKGYYQKVVYMYLFILIVPVIYMLCKSELKQSHCKGTNIGCIYYCFVTFKMYCTHIIYNIIYNMLSL